MLLCDAEILEGIKNKTIIISPFDEKNLGCNSYDVHLGRTLGVYVDEVLDSKKHNPISLFEIPEEGYVLMPGRLYLGVTVEYTETHEFVPFIDGKSSTGRLGVDIHATAGVGDVGFSNHWTLEISVIHPVKVYRDMPIGQIYFHTINHNKIKTPYNKKTSAKYNKRCEIPVESKMFMNF